MRIAPAPSCGRTGATRADASPMTRTCRRPCLHRVGPALGLTSLLTSSLVHDLFRKPVPTFRDHALSLFAGVAMRVPARAETRGAAASPACPGEAPGEDQLPTAPDHQTLRQLHRARQALVRESESTAKSCASPVKTGDSLRCAAASIGYR